MGWHAVVHQASAEVLSVDPSGDGTVMLVGHEHRQRERADEPLCGRFPLRCVAGYGDEFGCVGQVGRDEPERVGDMAAQLGVLDRDVAITRGGFG
ncbi:MAG: hypothetical protein ACRDNS_13315 [Trebonia sp.]